MKPAFWIVYIPGQDPLKFTQRVTLRAYVTAQKLLGKKPIIKPIGV